MSTASLGPSHEGKPVKKRRSRSSAKTARICVRVKADEFLQIQINAMMSGLSVSEFIRAVALAGPIDPPDDAPMWEPRLRGRIGKIANNLSQLLHYTTDMNEPNGVGFLAQLTVDEAPITVVHIERSIAPADMGASFFERLDEPGKALNSIVAALHAGNRKDMIKGAIPHLNTIREIMREVRGVC